MLESHTFLIFKNAVPCSGNKLFMWGKSILKDFQESLMDDMPSKNSSSCTVSYTALPIKTNLLCTFNQHCVCYKFPTDSNSTLLCFLKALRNCVALTQLFPRCAARSKRRLSTYRPIHISSMGHNRGWVSNSLIRQMHRFDTKQLVVKVEILTVNELWSRVFLNKTSFIEKQD